MKRTQIFGGVLAAVLTISLSSAASAVNYGSKEANLQAMRWYAQQQMSKGMPNPYPGVNLSTGQGFSEFQRGAYSPYGTNYGYGYGGNPYYGNAYNNGYNNGYNNNYANQWYGNTGGLWY